MSQSAPTHRGELLLFARNFLKHPRMLGSLIPSSRFLIDEVLQAVDWANARVIVEYGPGVGTFTAEVLRRMRPDASLIARLTAMLLLPTPPLPLVTAMTVARVACWAIRRSCVA